MSQVMNNRALKWSLTSLVSILFRILQDPVQDSAQEWDPIQCLYAQQHSGQDRTMNRILALIRFLCKICILSRMDYVDKILGRILCMILAMDKTITSILVLIRILCKIRILSRILFCQQDPGQDLVQDPSHGQDHNQDPCPDQDPL